MATNFYTQLAQAGAAREGQTFNPTLGLYGRAIDPLSNPYFGTSPVTSLGNADGTGLFDYTQLPGFEQFMMPEPPQDSGLNAGAVNPAAFASYLQSRGLSFLQSDVGPGGLGYRWVQDAAGNLVGNPMEYNNRDNAFLAAALLGAGVTGANIFGALGGLGGGTQTLTASGAMANPVPTVSGLGTGGGGIASGSGLTFALPTPTSLATTGLGASGGAGSGLTLGTAGSGLSLGGVTAGAPVASGNFFTNALSGIGNQITSNPLGSLQSLFNIGSGIYGMNLARDAAKQSDPFAPYRQDYARMLMELEANPSLIRQRPGFVAGLEAINRNNAARGYAGSGNESAMLSRYAGDFFNNELARLGGFAGAGQTPGAGAFPAAQLTSNSLASIGYGLAPFLGGPR